MIIWMGRCPLRTSDVLLDGCWMPTLMARCPLGSDGFWWQELVYCSPETARMVDKHAIQRPSCTSWWCPSASFPSAIQSFKFSAIISIKIRQNRRFWCSPSKMWMQQRQLSAIISTFNQLLHLLGLLDCLTPIKHEQCCKYKWNTEWAAWPSIADRSLWSKSPRAEFNSGAPATSIRAGFRRQMKVLCGFL